MKRSKRLVLSALAGLAAMAISYMAIAGAQEEAASVKRQMAEKYGGELTSVCVASREIEPGEKIDEGNTIVTEWVSTLLPDGAISSLSDVAGRTATAQIPAHAPLADAYFEVREGSIDVPRGMVAVSIASDPEHSVGGALTRGESVDVYAQGDAKADKLTSARVIDSSALAAGGGDVQWVTLAVRPSAVREVLAASSRGMLSLVAPGENARSKDRAEAAKDDAAVSASGEREGVASKEKAQGAKAPDEIGG